MSEVSLEAESETITTDLQMDYKEDHKTEDSLRSDLDDENDDNYETVDLDKDHCHTDAHHVESRFEEVDQQLETDVQGVGEGACSDTDVENSGDAVITKGSADDGEQHGTHDHNNTSETPEANGETCPQTQVIFVFPSSVCDRPLSSAFLAIVNLFWGCFLVMHTCCALWLTCLLLLWLTWLSVAGAFVLSFLLGSLLGLCCGTFNQDSIRGRGLAVGCRCTCAATWGSCCLC